MVIREVRSPVSSSTPGSKLASRLPLSPGSRSDPGRRDAVPDQPRHAEEPEERQERKDR